MKQKELSRTSLKRRLRRATSEIHRKTWAAHVNGYISGGFHTNSLCGLCAKASYALRKILCSKGFDAELVQGHYGEDDSLKNLINHCWVECNGFILDPTHDQFDEDRPFIVDSSGFLPYTPIVKGHYEVEFKDWPSDQAPNDEDAEKIIFIDNYVARSLHL